MNHTCLKIAILLPLLKNTFQTCHLYLIQRFKCSLTASMHAVIKIIEEIQNLFLVQFCDFSALTLLVGRREEHSTSKNWVVRCWHGYLSLERGTRGPADATATPSSLVSSKFRSV